MNGVDRVKAICKERKIPISKLERDLGYANGYIGQLRKGVFPSDRLMEIAEYLSVSHTYILTGEQIEKAPTNSGEHSVSDKEIKFALFRGREDITDAMYEEVLSFAEYVARREEERKRKE